VASLDFSYGKLKEYDNHKAIVSFFEPKSQLKAFVAIHRGGLFLPSFGATRIWKYSVELDAIKDSLRLSRGMSYKSALAGLPYGGAKAVICLPSQHMNLSERNTLIKTYAKYTNYLNGHFITGADVGVDEDDLKLMASNSHSIVGIHSDPVKFTVLGVFYAIQVCLKEITNTNDISGKSFAIQGLGKTGMGLLRLIAPVAGKVYVSDIDNTKTLAAKKEFSNIEIVKYSEIHKQTVDIFSPCALSNIINLRTVSKLHCKAIVGSANSQLQNAHLGELLFKLGILYAPDYVINAGGLITVADEYENRKKDSNTPRQKNNDLNEERVKKKVLKIKDKLHLIIERSKRRHKAPNIIADEMAESIFRKFS